MDAHRLSIEQDEHSARAAIEKRRLGKKPSRGELAALARVQERKLLQSVQSMAPKTFRELTGLQTKQLHDWESRYGIPCGRGRDTINLFDVMAAIRELIADGARGGQGGGGLIEKKSELLERQIKKLEEQIRKLQNENESQEGRTVPRDSLVELHERLAANLRNLGDNFARKSTLKGSEAQAMLNAALKTYQRQLEPLKRN